MGNNKSRLIALAALIAIGTIMLVQQNATNQTGMNATNYTAQAKPDQTKFCADFNNDDGTTGQSCQYKSKGECKKGSIAAGDDFRGCSKNAGSGGGSGNDLTGDADEEGPGSGGQESEGPETPITPPEPPTPDIPGLEEDPDGAGAN